MPCRCRQTVHPVARTCAWNVAAPEVSVVCKTSAAPMPVRVQHHPIHSLDMGEQIDDGACVSSVSKCTFEPKLYGQLP